MEKVLLTPREASERYGINIYTLYKKAEKKEIPSVCIGRLRRFPLKCLDKLFLGEFKET